MPSVAYNVSRKHWTTKLSRSRFLAVQPLNPVYCGLGWNRRFPDFPDVLIAYKPNSAVMLDAAKKGIRTVIQYNEINDKRFRKEQLECRPSLTLFHHLNDFRRYRAEFRNSVHVPHMADPRYFFDDGRERTIDFLLVGNLSENVYPLRAKFLVALMKLRDKGHNCVTWKHPGYEITDADSCRHLMAFGDAMRSAKVTCFCSSIYRYRLEKYPEAAACGTCVAADVPVSEDEMDFIVECDETMSVERLVAVLESELEAWMWYADAGVRYAKRHTPESYSKRLLAALDVPR